MDAWNYIALGGLERIVIIGAATLIGYWGYRIFASSRGAGLALITVAALVLVGALLTTGQHLERLNGTLVASNTPTAPTPPAAAPAASLEVAEPAPVPAVTAADADAAAIPAADAAASAEALAEGAAGAGAADAAPAENETVVVEAAAEDNRVPRIVPLASGQELGGRITSVRSENVTLEWSPEVSRRRVISSSREP